MKKLFCTRIPIHSQLISFSIISKSKIFLLFHTFSFSYWTDDDRKSRKPSLFCSDISYWIDKPCYEDHEFFDKNGFAKYLETRRCSYYQNNFTSFHDKHSCPHTWEYNSEKQNCFPKLWPLTKKECENATKYFYCNISQRCIPRQWLCDGAVQCPIAAEDEAFEFCQSQETTRKCAGLGHGTRTDR